VQWARYCTELFAGEQACLETRVHTYPEQLPFDKSTRNPRIRHLFDKRSSYILFNYNMLHTFTTQKKTCTAIL